MRKALAELRAAHPDLILTEAFDFATPVQEEYDGSMWLLYEGALLAVIVVWLFLRDWRATFVSAVALPLSVIPAFIGMNYLGFSVNVVTLLALSLVVGVLVDDAIVEVENIVRHLRMGKRPYQAAMEAADAKGGDKRCTCETEPKPKAACDGKTAHVAYILIANKEDKTENEYIYKGIASRHFRQSFALANHVKVKDSELKNGILKIELESEVPLEMKPRTIEIK